MFTYTPAFELQREFNLAILSVIRDLGNECSRDDILSQPAMDDYTWVQIVTQLDYMVLWGMIHRLTSTKSVQSNRKQAWQAGLALIYVGLRLLRGKTTFMVNAERKYPDIFAYALLFHGEEVLRRCLAEAS